MKSIKNPFSKFISILIMATILCSLYFFSSFQKTYPLVSVNGYKIYNNDVDSIYDQFDDKTEYTKDIILQDLIDQMITLSFAQSMDIEIEQNTLDQLIKEYMETYPDLYKEGVVIYGEESFSQSLKEQLIYEKVYDTVIECALEYDKDAETENFRNHMAKKYPELNPSELSNDLLLDEFSMEFQDYIFEKWLALKKEQSNIIYY